MGVSGWFEVPADHGVLLVALLPGAIVLLPGFEYRVLEWRHPDTHEVHWRMERRKAVQHFDDDE